MSSYRVSSGSPFPLEHSDFSQSIHGLPDFETLHQIAETNKRFKTENSELKNEITILQAQITYLYVQLLKINPAPKTTEEELIKLFKEYTLPGKGHRVDEETDYFNGTIIPYLNPRIHDISFWIVFISFSEHYYVRKFLLEKILAISKSNLMLHGNITQKLEKLLLNSW
jgi:hypothetical protein